MTKPNRDPKKPPFLPDPRETRLTYRATYSLPRELCHKISDISKRMGVSQSALLAELLEEPIDAMHEVLTLIPPSPTPDDVLRARGKSAQVIRDVVQQALHVAQELDPNASRHL